MRLPGCQYALSRRNIATILATLVLCLVSIICSAQVADSSDSAIIANWIQAAQYTDPNLASFGALKVHSTPAAFTTERKQYYRASPYIGNLAVIGLLESKASFRTMGCGEVDHLVPGAPHAKERAGRRSCTSNSIWQMAVGKLPA